MVPRLCALAAPALLALSACAPLQTAKTPEGKPQPKLVVFMVVDGLPQE